MKKNCIATFVAGLAAGLAIGLSVGLSIVPANASLKLPRAGVVLTHKGRYVPIPVNGCRILLGDDSLPYNTSAVCGRQTYPRSR